MSPAPNRRHQGVSANILSELILFLKGKPCKAYAAPFDVVLPDSPDQAATVVQPDISVICDQSKLTDAGCIGAPDLVVEILSPATSAKDTGTNARSSPRGRHSPMISCSTPIPVRAISSARLRRSGWATETRESRASCTRSSR